MTKIWKELLNKKGLSLWLPNHSEILTCQEQDGSIVVWFSFEEENEQNLDLWKFKVIMTGEGFEKEQMLYLNTVTLSDLVFHIFYESPTQRIMEF